MAVTVKLKDIIEGLEFQSDEGSSYLNTMTGEVIYITEEELRAAEEDAPLEDFPTWQHEAIRIAGEMLETDHYRPLPTKFDIHEYRIKALSENTPSAPPPHNPTIDVPGCSPHCPVAYHWRFP